jgi:hypothetical protein
MVLLHLLTEGLQVRVLGLPDANFGQCNLRIIGPCRVSYEASLLGPGRRMFLAVRDACLFFVGPNTPGCDPGGDTYPKQSRERINQARSHANNSFLKEITSATRRHKWVLALKQLI